MKPTIFTRMVIGYLAIFVSVIAVNGYAISQLNLFNRITGYILEIDKSMRDFEKKLTDSLLSQMRYERKYVITKDKELRYQFIAAEGEFSKYIDEAATAADTAHKREALTRIKDYYKLYTSLFDEEAGFLDTGQTYSQNLYREKKEKAVDGITKELRNFKLYIEQDTYEKIRNLQKSGAEAHGMAMIIAVISILSGIVISIFITKSITKPLSFMKRKTREIAGGNFEGNLDVSSPPEIRDLAQAFNLMCNRLKEMDKMKSDFFSLMAHELRTPLTSIKEGTNLLIEGIGGEVTDRQKKLFRIIAEESNRLIDLANSLLDLSKMEAGMMSFNFINSEIKRLINRAVAEIEPLAVAKNINLKVNIAQDLPIIKMDSERILLVLRNLIGNAVKFTPGGGHVTISAQTAGKEVTVSVADTGPGIPKEDLHAIFDKFKQATMTGYNKIKGTGLGLAIAKYIINAHGGKIWVESESGHGSIFIFVLPA